jgi:hypothetical protein
MEIVGTNRQAAIKVAFKTTDRRDIKRSPKEMRASAAPTRT